MKKKTLKNSILGYGYVTQVGDAVISFTGLPKCFMGEVIVFNTPNDMDIIGSVASLPDPTDIKAILVKGSQSALNPGVKVFRTYGRLQTKVGFGMLGKIVTTLGDLVDVDEYADKKYDLLNEGLNIEYTNISARSPSIIERETVATPFFTGVSTVDCFTPIGCGQRQLIIGDFNTGKTSLALTMLLNQRYIINFVDKVWRGLENKLTISFSSRALKFMPCIFVAIGKRRSEVLRLKRVLQSFNAMYFTTVIFTSSEDLPALQFFAPFAGCSMGEWFRSRAYNALVIFDDLSQHAVAYRQITLLLRIPPGREAYPGDIFYVQAKLLERGAQLSKQFGSGSLTILPLIETKGGDISAYIPTNVISITDGQIFLSSNIINAGLRPGVNIGLSVSRVGSKAQYNCVKYVSKKIKRDYILYKTYEGLSKISSDMDPTLLSYVNRGLIILKYLSQKLYKTVKLFKQVITFYCLSEGLFDGIDVSYLGIYFELYFKGYFLSDYLENNEELFKYLMNRNAEFVESLLIASSIEPSLKEIGFLSRLFSNFFKSEIYVRMNTNEVYYNLVLIALKSNIVLRSGISS